MVHPPSNQGQVPPVHLVGSKHQRQGGVRPIVVGALPSQCAALNRTFLNVVELTVRAALEERRDLVYQAAYVDPNAAANLTLDQIRSMCDELLEAHSELLPRGLRGG